MLAKTRVAFLYIAHTHLLSLVRTSHRHGLDVAIVLMKFRLRNTGDSIAILFV